MKLPSWLRGPKRTRFRSLDAYMATSIIDGTGRVLTPREWGEANGFGNDDYLSANRGYLTLLAKELNSTRATLGEVRAAATAASCLATNAVTLARGMKS